MAFDGNGTYTPKSPEYPATAGTVIKAADWNAVISDIASALSLVLVRDGQAAMVNHLNMGTKKVQNLADGTVSTDAVTFGQIMTAAIVALKALTPAADAFPFFDSTSTASLLTIVSAIRTVLASADVATMRTNMGLGDSATKNTGTTEGTVSAGDHNHSALYQPLDADLTALAGLTSAADKVPYFTGSGTADLMTVTTAARALLDDANAAAMRTTLGAQTADATLTALAAVTVAANKMIYATDADTFSTCDLTAFARTLLAASSAVAARTVLGVQASIGDALAVMYALLYCRSESRASGPIPYGYLFPLLTDELATKTGATYDSGGKYYHNAASTSAVTLTSGMLSRSANIGDWNATQLVDGSTSTTGFSAGSAGTSDYVEVAIGSAKNLCQMDIYVDGSTTAQWYVKYYNGSTWVTAATINMSGGAGWKTISWTAISAETWRIYPVSTPGAGPYYKEMKVYEYTAPTNMTLIPATVTAGEHPGSMTVRFLHKAVEATTYNTDLKLRVSTDGGSNWSGYGTIAKLCAYDANYDLLEATIDTSALTGVSLKPEISTANTKSQRVAGIAISYA